MHENLADHQNVVRWWHVLNYMRTPPTHYFLEYSGCTAYTELKLTLSNLHLTTHILESRLD
jgi:hypothetical protein